jgi:antibiotic biosynthesis monooxygenase (ABM) superfamily enzyme
MTDPRRVDNDSTAGSAAERGGSAAGAETVSSAIHHRVKPGTEAQYETWLREITPTAERFPGHTGVNIVRPPGGSGTYTIVLHFDSMAHLRGWLESQARKRLIDQVAPLLERREDIEIKTGLEFWFTPPTPAQKHPEPYKQCLVTLSAIFPLTIIVPWALRPLFQVAPALSLPGVSNLLVSAIIVGLMTYVIMPRYTRLLAGWLYR